MEFTPGKYWIDRTTKDGVCYDRQLVGSLAEIWSALLRDVYDATACRNMVVWEEDAEGFFREVLTVSFD